MLTENGLEDEREPSPEIESRPWGRFVILDEGHDFKVKRIEVLPGKRLSYQRHQRRAEHWFVVRGTAKVTLNGEEILVPAGSAIDIGLEVAHRVYNPDSSELLVFVETHTGTYIGEYDIHRLDDEFGRAESSVQHLPNSLRTQ